MTPPRTGQTADRVAAALDQWHLQQAFDLLEALPPDERRARERNDGRGINDPSEVDNNWQGMP